MLGIPFENVYGLHFREARIRPYVDHRLEKGFERGLIMVVHYPSKQFLAARYKLREILHVPVSPIMFPVLSVILASIIFIAEGLAK